MKCYTLLLINLSLTVYLPITSYPSTHYILPIHPLHITHLPITSYPSSHYILPVYSLHLTHAPITSYPSTLYILPIHQLHLTHHILPTSIYPSHLTHPQSDHKVCSSLCSFVPFVNLTIYIQFISLKYYSRTTF
jgi:hypothetical protein